MAQTYKPGQSIRCTVVKDPRTESAKKTLLRLMRQDPKVSKGLKKAQEERVRTLLIVSRGKRPWEVRETSSKIARAVKGASWTMKYFPQIGPDVASVSEYIKIEAA